MLMIEPPPAAFISPITAFRPSQHPTAFTSRTRRNSASGISAIRANVSTPALFTSTSSLPKASAASATAAAQPASLVTSWWMYRHDFSSNSAASAAPLSSSTSPNTTRAPWATRWRTCDLPIPRAPPVISATLPSSRPIVPPGRPSVNQTLAWCEGNSQPLAGSGSGSGGRGVAHAGGDPFEQDAQEAVDHLVGGVAAGPAPLRGNPQDVLEQPVGELGIQVRPEQAR